MGCTLSGACGWGSGSTALGLSVLLAACALETTPIKPKGGAMPVGDAGDGRAGGPAPPPAGSPEAGVGSPDAQQAPESGTASQDANMPPRGDAMPPRGDAASHDGGVDAGTDAGSDASTDGGTDAGIDSGSDAGTDAGTDSSPDCDPPPPCYCPHEDAPAGECEAAECELADCAPDDGCEYASSATGRYYLCAGERTWSAARDQCETRAGMRLASVESVEEDDFLLSLLDDKTWVGGNDGTQEGRWDWVGGGAFYSEATGQPVGGAYVNWDPGEPNNLGLAGDADCMILWFQNLDWADASCSDAHAFVCEVQ